MKKNNKYYCNGSSDKGYGRENNIKELKVMEMGALCDRITRAGLIAKLILLNREVSEVREQAYKYWGKNNSGRMQHKYKDSGSEKRI